MAVVRLLYECVIIICVVTMAMLLKSGDNLFDFVHIPLAFDDVILDVYLSPPLQQQ